IQTNTFGANRYKLARHGLEKKVAEINHAATELARRVIMASFKDVLIAGDVGPLGVRLAPFGRVQPEQAREAFQEQIQALVSAGVDLLIIETMSDLFEINEAVHAARAVSPTIPIVASMTFTRDDLTLLGDKPQKVARYLHDSGADLIGVNCSGGPHQLLRILKLMREEIPDGRFSVMPNAGWPEQVGGRIMYPAAPEYFGDYALAFCESGASLVGGCCGTTPQHIQAMARALQSSPQGCAPDMGITLVSTPEEALPAEQPTRLAEKLASGKFVVAVEMDPPRGLSTHKIIAGASLLAESGADVVNVADSPMARMRMSPWAVCSLIQAQVGIETVLHFPTRGRNLLRVQGDLLAAHALGVRNVFVVMGDPTAIGDYPNAMDNYDLVPSGLIKLIKQNFNAGVDHAGSDIGQPTGFYVGCALNLNPPDPDVEIKNLKRKIRAGADFILTQPVYDPPKAEEFIRLINHTLEEPLSLPIIAGILPLASGRHANFLHQEVPGILIPQEIRERMERSGETGAKEGIQIATELVAAMHSFTRGVYIMPAFNRFDYAAEIIENIVDQVQDA
ncbi:MAG TPA: bifunctional homocysteine S-methyltransferase/methylenetetrahydrofolate reductase, partial [Anaerolinea sp.]|nr:bifunctional homocysteine S-methyltransferase/methylenetetrahydrofolate reductase [Anaerolinea sp.]